MDENLRLPLLHFLIIVFQPCVVYFPFSLCSSPVSMQIPQHTPVPDTHCLYQVCLSELIARTRMCIAQVLNASAILSNENILNCIFLIFIFDEE